ncbi:hypothetical protein PFISCL1PPCAC_17044, partial [Pristionchus fissidentatus]
MREERRRYERKDQIFSLLFSNSFPHKTVVFKYEENEGRDGLPLSILLLYLLLPLEVVAMTRRI